MSLNENGEHRFYSPVAHLDELLRETRDTQSHEDEEQVWQTTLARYQSAMIVAQRVYTCRRTRAKHFKDKRLFGEPAWDMLLDLFIRQGRDESVSVKEASIGSMVTETTAQRWMHVLVKDGLVKIEGDTTDHRRRKVVLTSKGTTAMTKFFEEIERAA